MYLFTTLVTRFAAIPAKCGKTFFGLEPWYKYLKLDPTTCEITNFTFFPNSNKSDVPLILLAVVDDLLRLAGMLAVVFIIVGGFKYVTSQGNPDETSKAQSTIVNALIGLAVALVAISAVSFIGNRLGGV